MSEKPYQSSVQLMNVKNPELYALTTKKQLKINMNLPCK